MNTDTLQPDNPGHGSSPALIDAHVHLYDCHDYTTFFDAALRNFSNAAQSLSLPRDTPGVLMLTETAKDNAFQSLIDQPELDGGRWKFTPNNDGLSITASIKGRDALTIIAGKQIVTQEGLEVLALGTNHNFTQGLDVRHTIEKASQCHGLPVLPFGVGKWTGQRGKIVNDLIHDESFPIRFMLGDNAGRLALAGTPKQFDQAQHKNIWTLPGTDPLPFPSQAIRVARTGLVLRGVDLNSPAESIKQRLKSADAQPVSFGHGAGVFRFFSLQVAMQLRKRMKKH